MDKTEEPGNGDEVEAANGAKESREEREKRKMRGKGKSLKRYLRKQRKNVIDPAAVTVRGNLEKQKEERKREKLVAAGGEEPKNPSALDRLKRSK